MIVVKRLDANFYSDCDMDIYQYDQESESVTHLAGMFDGNFCGPMALFGDHLALSNDNGLFVYRRQGTNGPFSSPQFIDPLQYGGGFGRALSMDEAILVVGSYNHTHVFSLKDDGMWEEMLVLDQSYDSYQVSGHAIVAANQTEAVAMDIADCMQPIPTQMPSVSLAPTTCHEVEFKYYSYKDNDWDDEWDWGAIIQRIDTDVVFIEAFPLNQSDWDEIEKMHLTPLSDYCTLHYHSNYYCETNATLNSYGKSLCLQQGRYQLRLQQKDIWWNLQFIDWYYSVESIGQVITQGTVDLETWGKFDETVEFDLPFEKPTTSPSPTISLIPTLPPTSTYPTEPFPTLPPTTTKSPSTAFPTISPTTTKAPQTPLPTTLSPITPFPTNYLRTICRLRTECENQQEHMGLAKFYAGYYSDYGCFSKNGNLYWGFDGTEEQISTSPLGGAKERVWCDPITTTSPTPAHSNNLFSDESSSQTSIPSITHKPSSSSLQPSITSTKSTCLTQVECEGKQEEKGYASFSTGIYSDYGCFSRNNNLFWGIGGTEEQMSVSQLSKKKERVWC